MGMIARSLCLLALVAGLIGCSPLRSQNVREVDGVKYYTHTVSKGETLYAIAKHYAVPMDAIERNNPGSSDGISIGQVLMIPVKAQIKKELKTAPGLRNGDLIHTVRKKETLFGIARSYNVDQDSLVARNPEIKSGLKEGMTLMIPVATVRNVETIALMPAFDDKSTAHLVQPGETLYSLGKRYDVTPEAILEANGGLPNGPKAGTYLRIPAKPKPATAEPVVTAPPTPGAVHRIALLLPFSITANDSMLARSKEDKSYYSVTAAAVQFYAGARMALDSMKSLGLSADVNVFDVGEDARAWGPVMKNNKLRSMELCIGPFHRTAIEELVRAAPSAHIVCPVPQSNKVLLGNPRVSKVLGSKPDQLQHMGRFIAFHHGRDNIIFCRPAIPGEKDLQEQLMRTINEGLTTQVNRLIDSVRAVVPGRRDAAEVIKRLEAGRLNVVVVPSEDVEFVTTLVNKLSELVPEKRIVVYGMPAWNTMDNLEAAHLNALDVHVPASSFVDLNDPRVEHFIQQYRDRFLNEPGEYAFLGFDVTFFYLQALYLYGPAFPDHFNEVNTAPLHLGFRMRKAGDENGYRNESALMLHYKDMGLQKAQ
jgi:LysM repeat protein